eukprot:COSAG06_NODE_10518_length_1667_cov_2.087372_2_plen_124_part_00
MLRAGPVVVGRLCVRCRNRAGSLLPSTAQLLRVQRCHRDRCGLLREAYAWDDDEELGSVRMADLGGLLTGQAPSLSSTLVTTTLERGLSLESRRRKTTLAERPRDNLSLPRDTLNEAACVEAY